jgi:SAM-dependent methyltransferase
MDAGSAAALDRLEARLGAFYRDAEGYFPTGGNEPSYLAFAGLIESLLRVKPTIAVLEVGAGQSDFARWLAYRGWRDRVHYTANDLSEMNRPHLDAVADRVLIGDAPALGPGGPFDLVFCCFVFEHLVRPRRFLDWAVEALTPGGYLVLVGPRYTLPFYVPPALRHLPWAARMAVHLKALAIHWATYFSPEPNFLVVGEPALFHRPYGRDADAVHLVTRRDLVKSLERRGRCFDLSPWRPGLKEALRARLGLLCFAFRKN